MTLLAGTRLGPYEITGPLGAGGMGEVYRAIDTTLGREVAIKTLPGAFATDPERLARFEREARLLAALNHAHIASIHGLHEHEGARFLSMELVGGETLQQKLKAGALPVEEALTMALQITEALQAAHDKGIVHRDLKPANVMITCDGVVKVLDFGLAKAFAAGANDAGDRKALPLGIDMTQQGVMLGTAGYMSPEQATGQPTDQRSDIWAFGVVLYEMLTGLPPFAGDTTQHVVADILKSEPDWSRLPKKVHPLVRLLLERCLEKKLRSRYHSIADARLDIETALREPEHDRFGPGAHAMRPATPLLAAALVIAVIGGALLWILPREANEFPPAVARFAITPSATTPLANFAGNEIAISADGTRTAYVARDPSGSINSLYVRYTDSLEPRQVQGTEVERGGAFNPFFSPDGKEIGYGAGDRGIMRVDLASGVQRQIVPFPAGFAGAAWTEDGTLIYSARNGLNRVPIDGSEASEEILNVAPNLLGPPRLLPDDRHALLSYRDTAKGTEDIVVVDLRTGRRETVIENGTDPFYVPTGHIVFARNGALMAALFDLDRPTDTGEAVALESEGGDAILVVDLAISENGSLAYLPASDQIGQSVVWLDRDGNVSGPAIDALLENPRGVRVSPNGRRLAVLTGPSGDAQLWIYENGLQPFELWDGADIRAPVWSPGSTHVAFPSDHDGSHQTYTLPAEFSVQTPRLIGPYGRQSFPSDWVLPPDSTDEVLFLFVTRESRDIVATNPDSPKELRDVVATTEDDEVNATLSPDGQWLAYISDRNGAPQVWVKRYPDGTGRPVGPVGSREPVWSSDGRELYLIQGNEMMSIAVATEGEFPFAEAIRLFTIGDDIVIRPTNAVTYDVGPDGRFLMVREPAANGDTARQSVVVVQNWFVELEKQVPTD